MEPGWSWRGDRVVYRKSSPIEGRRGWTSTIESRDLEGGSPQVIIESARQIGDFVMLEDRILYSGRSDDPWNRDSNLFELRLNPETLEPVGEPRQLTELSGFELWDLSATRDGKRLVFLKDRQQTDVHVGEIRDGGKRLDGIRRLSLNDRNDWPNSWTPDGEAVIYGSDRSGQPGLYLQALDQRTASTLVAGSNAVRGAWLTPDGASLLYWSIDLPSPEERMQERFRFEPSLMRVPIDGGPTDVVMEKAQGFEIRCSSVVDGGCIGVVFDRSTVNKQSIVRLDPEAGLGEELFTREFDLASHPEWDLSPDGSRLVMVGDVEEDRTLSVLDLNGELIEEVEIRGLAGAVYDEIAWNATGDGFFAVGESARGSLVAYVEPSGVAHALEILETGYVADVDPTPSRDGRRLAWRAKTVESNVWMVEGF
jgi:Tol biopolymer transport system component